MMFSSIEYKLRLKHCSKNELKKFLAKTLLYKDRYTLNQHDSMVGDSASKISLRDMHSDHDDNEHDHGDRGDYTSDHPDDHEDDHNNEHKKNKKDCWFVMTSDMPDREGDRIYQNGLDTTFLEKYGSVLWGHRSDHPEFVLGKICDIVREEHRTLVNVDFASAETNPMAARVSKMIESGIVSGMSIGFLLHEYSVAEDRPGMMPLNIWRSEAIETSITPVPMNAQAVIERQCGVEEKKELISIIEQTIEETPVGNLENVQIAATVALKELNNNRIYSLPKKAQQEIVQMCIKTLMGID